MWFVAAGALLGYLSASDKLNPFQSAYATSRPTDGSDRLEAVTPGDHTRQPCCSGELNTATLLALATPPTATTASAAQGSGKKPNILVIWGDDIGVHNISAYSHGIMGYRTPNIDRIAREGALFTDAYGNRARRAARRSSWVSIPSGRGC